ncbi:Cystic fibrosis transmembrane conductance regulator [Pseudolycoriella hygida]|uniref:Cystic fibrosis transmembrane conductance regulator n=1 Tax=Pseudolycoriella hygida TaxID=35572 RepID=A0A9Q0SAN5_9DIPT|nr:Cystic fibrosis transmembrane conductance regulator [Pseudolycoriella hygida]
MLKGLQRSTIHANSIFFKYQNRTAGKAIKLSEDIEIAGECVVNGQMNNKVDQVTPIPINNDVTYCKKQNCQGNLDFHRQKISRIWTDECKKCDRPSLKYAVAKLFWKELTVMAVICFVNDVVICLTLPFLLGNLLNYYRKDGNMTHEDAVKYGIAIVAISVLLGLIQVHYYFNGRHYGMNIRTAICSLIYGKVTKEILLKFEVPGEP